MSNHQPLRLAEGMNLIQFRRRGWTSGPSALAQKPRVRHPLPGDSLASFLLHNNFNTLKFPFSPFSLTLTDTYWDKNHQDRINGRWGGGGGGGRTKALCARVAY